LEFGSLVFESIDCRLEGPTGLVVESVMQKKDLAAGQIHLSEPPTEMTKGLRS
jgi:hypothetical protein